MRSGAFASAQDVVRTRLELLEKRDEAQLPNDFQPGKWDRLLVEAEGGQEMTLEEAIDKRRAARCTSGNAQ